MNRREYLSVLSAAGLAPALAGCSGAFGGPSDDGGGTSTPTTTSEPDISDQTFEYFFQDSAGTLGQVGDEEVPEDAADRQVVNNELEENEWDGMQSNDLDGAREVMERDYESSVDDIISRTEEILQNPEQELSEFDSTGDLDFENDPTAVIYTAALVKAADETDIASSGGKDTVINSIAEPVLEQLDIEAPGYSISTLMSTESCSPDRCSWAEGQVPRDISPEDREGEKIKVNSGFNHQPGLLQYENEEGEQEVKYVEVTGPQSPFVKWIRDPEDSFYAMSLDTETYEGHKVFPEHFVTALEYSKARELQNMGAIHPDNLDQAIATSLYHLVDDNENDVGPSYDDVKSYGDTPGWDVIVEDSFGESLEEFKRNPTKQKAEYVENAGRGLKLAFEKNGYDEPLRLSGTLEDPTYEHLARDKFESIIDERQQQAS